MDTAAEILTKHVTCSHCASDDASVVASGEDYIYHGSSQTMTHVACNVCGHVYLNPQPLPAALPRMYPANYGTFSSKFRGSGNLLGQLKTYVNIRRFRAANGALRPGMSILDVGCGNGELLLALAETEQNLQLYGIDWHFPPETRAVLEGAGITLIEEPLETADFGGARFDVIVMYQLVEHLWDPRGGIASLAQHLKPGGRVIIETPDTDGYDRRLFRSGAWGGYYVPRHLNLYNFDRLKAVLEQAGLEVVSQSSLPAPIVWCYSMQGAIQRGARQLRFLNSVFDIRNLAAVAAFAAMDTLAAKIGMRTSNQQAVAVKRQLKPQCAAAG